MFRFIFSLLSLLVIAVILVLVLSNRETATLDLDLILDPQVVRLALPLWVWLFVFIALGFVWGMVFSFFQGGTKRKLLRQTKRDLKKVEAELAAMKGQEVGQSRALIAAAKLSK